MLSEVNGSDPSLCLMWYPVQQNGSDPGLCLMWYPVQQNGSDPGLCLMWYPVQQNGSDPGLCLMWYPVQRTSFNPSLTECDRCWILYFVGHASRYKFLLITNLTRFFMHLFISSLDMFRASQCSSSGDQIVLIHHLAWLVCVSDAWYAGPSRPAYQAVT